MILTLILVISFSLALPDLSVQKQEGTRAAGDDINLYWIGLNKTENEHSLLDTEVGTEKNNTLRFAGNYTGGWDNAIVVIKAWYDDGKTGNLSGYTCSSFYV